MQGRQLVRGGLVRACLVVAALAGMLALAPAAFASTGTITGKVTQEDGTTPIAGACVTTIGSFNGDSDVTATDGTYSLTVEEHNNWMVIFGSCGDQSPLWGNGPYVTETYNEARGGNTATRVTVYGGQETSNINGTLHLGGTLSGTVKNTDGDPVAGVCVDATLTGDVFSIYGSHTTTDADGNYSLGGLDGDYTLYYGCTDDYLEQWWQNAPTWDDANTVSISPTDVLQDYDVTLSTGTSVSGTVTGPDGSGVENACATAYDTDGNYLGDVQTDADGRYTITRLPSTQVKVQFSPCAATAYVGEWWDDAPNENNATVIDLTSGHDVTDINAQLDLRKSIAGTVTDPSGDPVAGVCVELRRQGGDQLDGVSTDANGHYLLNNQGNFALLNGGPAYVSFEPSCSGPTELLDESYENVRDFSQATPIDMSGGAVTGIDAQLEQGATISGVVESEASGDPIGHACLLLTGDGGGDRYASTDSTDGSYSFSGLYPGTYYLKYSACGAGNFLSEWYDDQLNRATATPIQVGYGDDKVLDPAQLASGGVVSGTVTGQTGALSGICVGLYGDTGLYLSSTSTNATGDYQFAGLDDGAYTVSFDPCGSNNAVAGEYYDDAMKADDATPVQVHDHGVVDDVDAELAPEAVIHGTVYDENGNRMPYVHVQADTLDGRLGRDTYADYNGDYVIHRLQPRSYALQFNAQDGTHLRQWWDGNYRRAEADPIPLSAGDNFTADAHLALANQIQGTVSNAAGTPISGACVTALDPETGDYISGTDTDDDGSYSLAAPVGEWNVYFDGCNGQNLGEYYDDALSTADATPVDVTDSGPTTGIDAQLDPAGEISGTVTKMGGEPAHACIQLVDADRAPVDFTNTYGGGRYSFSHVQPGDYAVRFDDCDSGDLASEWWDDAHRFSDATPVTVAPGEETSGIDAELTGAGSISGHVSNPAGRDVDQACVSVYDTGGETVGFASTNPSGMYRASRLPAGTYKVQFTACGRGDVAPEFYAGASSFADATPVTVVAGSETDQIDGQLHAGARITGTVTQPDGSPADQVCVLALEQNEDAKAVADTTAMTGRDGAYALKGLGAVNYVVQFDPSCAGDPTLARQYYADSLTFADATPVTVGAPGTVTGGIDAQLHAKPRVRITSGPTGSTTDHRPSFGFNAGPSVAEIECSIDQGTPAYEPCSGARSHRPAADLVDGAYTFRVRASLDGIARTAKQQFTVTHEAPPPPTGPTGPATGPTGPTGPADPTAPDTKPGDTAAPHLRITKGPDGKTTDRTPTFAFNADEAATFACSVDGKATGPCSSPVTLERLKTGRHVFRVTATDAAGNSGFAERDFRVKKKRRHHHHHHPHHH